MAFLVPALPEEWSNAKQAGRMPTIYINGVSQMGWLGLRACDLTTAAEYINPELFPCSAKSSLSFVDRGHDSPSPAL